jgi:hypothetical protein
MKRREAVAVLQKAGVGYTENEMSAQQALVDALTAQAGVAERIHAISSTDKNNATKSTGNEMSAQRAAAAKEAADHTSKMGELALAAEKEQAEVSATIHAASIGARLAADIDLADKEAAIQQQQNQALIAGLDKSGKDYNNQLQGLRDKAVEIEAQHANAVAALRGKASVEQYQKDIADMQTGEREKINATEQGSSERLAAIDAAIKEEASKGLEATEHYREMLTERVQVARQLGAEQAKAEADAGKLAADNTQKMGELALAAWKEQAALADSAHRVTDQMRMQEDIEAANRETALKMTAMSQQIAALDKSGKDYENKLRELQDKQKQLVQQHENEITAIKDKATMDQNQRQLAGLLQLESITASGLTRVIMGHESFAKMLDTIGSQVVSGMVDNALKSMMALDMTKEREAAAAARKFFLAGASFPFPANIVMAPVLGAVGFASVMAFQDGGIVPGVGRGDIVPAMLEPGEGVVPRGVMEGLSNMSRSGGAGGSNVTHVVHLRPVYHLQAMDAEGMGRVLDKHSGQLQKHFENTVRKMNR